MHGPAASGDSPTGAALDSLASSMELGLLLVDSGQNPLYANQVALDLLGVGEGGLATAWLGLRAAIEDGPAAAGLRPFTADLLVDGKPRSLRGEVRERGAVREILLKDRRRLGTLDLELLCAARMKEWVHHCEALVHDANGALNTIQLTLELLDGQWPGPHAGEQVQEPHRRNHVGVIRDNLGKLKLILRRLVDDSDLAAAPFDARELLKEAAATLRMPARRRRVELQVSLAEAPVMIPANRARVRQALVNVALARLEAAPERTRLGLGAVVTPEGVELSCSDAAPLADVERAAIFGVLLSGRLADASGNLRLARTLVEADGANFEVRGGAPDTGTAFHFVFPRA